MNYLPTMEKNTKQCFQCGGAHGSPNLDLFGYTICTTCKSKLGLFQDKTVQRHVASFEKAKEQNSNLPSYLEEVEHRLICLEKDYIRKRIKLLHIQERINDIK